MVSYDYTEDQITRMEKDRKQIQTRLENLEYAMTIVEHQINNNNYDTQIKEIYEVLMGIVLGIVIFMVYVIHH